MSVVHDMLRNVEEKEQVRTTPWAPRSAGKGGLFVFDLPNEILNDFYDLKEYIRIANMQGGMRVLSIASASAGEGSSTIATYLSFLMSGGVAQRFEQKLQAQEKKAEVKEQGSLFGDEITHLSEQDETVEDDDTDNINPNEDILLVDGNLHNPSIHRYFGLEAGHGLADIITKKLDWRKVAQPVHESRLRIITAGRSSVSPIELISSDEFVRLVAEWRDAFKYVIFDSPPVLQYVDSMSLASIVDGVVLVVKAGQTRWEMAQHAKRKLATAQANLLGVALNRQKMEIPDGLYKRLMV